MDIHSFFAAKSLSIPKKQTTEDKERYYRELEAEGLGEHNAATDFDAWLVTLPHISTDLVAPAGAGVVGAPIWGAWGAYETVAKRRMEDSDESFRWVSYETQRQRAEDMLIAAVPEDRQMDMVYLNILNYAITTLVYTIARARRELAEGLFPLEFYQRSILSRRKDVEEAREDLAARRIQSWIRSLPPPTCQECGWGDCQEDGFCEWCLGKAEDDDGEGWRGTCACGEVELCDGLCADCYWDMRAERKRACREGRSILPPPPIRIPLNPNTEDESTFGPRVL